MSQTAQPVLVKKAYYEKDTDSVFWEVELPSKKVVTLMWLREEFGPTFNIHAEIPPKLVSEFCNTMIGKTVNLVTPEQV